MTNKLFIDFTQYDTWHRCPLKWLERYVLKQSRKTEGQRDDALTRGALVHAGIEQFNLRGVPKIPESVIGDLDPTPECLSLAGAMVCGWAKRCGGEPWRVKQSLEEPIRAPFAYGWDILAKVDRIFEVETPISIPSGLGYDITLEPGLWIDEYKTSGQKRNLFLKRWESDMQADFQMLAVREALGIEVRGILVNAIETPRVYVPKRKCKGECKQTWEFTSYIPVGDEYRCPMCGTQQKLKAVEPPKEIDVETFRLVAVRSSERLEMARDSIKFAIYGMRDYIDRVHAYEEFGEPYVAMFADAEWHECVGPWGACEFADVHSQLQLASSAPHIYTIRETLRYAEKSDLDVAA